MTEKTYAAFLAEQISYLEEKLLLFNNGARYGQIVFMAGGSGSGKSRVVKYYLETEKFKTINSDEIGAAYRALKPELRDLNMRDPQNVAKIHALMKAKGFRNEILDLILRANFGSETLPNLLFDTTLDDIRDVADDVPALLDAGYKPHNINLVWVLRDYKLAIKGNASRDRVVPEDIVLMKHEQTALVLTDLLTGALPSFIDGDIYVVLNNDHNEISVPGHSDNLIIKDFTYLRMKKAGQPLIAERDVQDQLYQWIVANIPRTEKTAKIFNFH